MQVTIMTNYTLENHIYGFISAANDHKASIP